MIRPVLIRVILLASVLLAPAIPVQAGPVESARRIANRPATFTTGLTSYVHVTGSEGESPVILRISFADPSTIRLQAGAGFAPPEIWPRLPFTARTRDGEVELTHNGLSCRLLLSPLRIRLGAAPGVLALSTGETSNAVRIIRDGDAPWIQFELEAAGDALLGGFGTSSEAASSSEIVFDANVRRLADVPPPTILSTGGWGLTFPSPASTTIRTSSPRSITLHDSAAEILVHLSRDGTIDDILRTRRAYLDPRPAPLPALFDPWISVDSYTPTEVIDDIRGRLSFLGLPDGIAALEDWSRPPRLAFRVRSPSFLSAAGPTVFRAPYTGSPLGEFENLRAALAAGLAAGSGGFEVVALDIGSYLNQRGHAPAPLTREPWIRWIQFAAFSPVMQTHMRHESLAPWAPPDPSVANAYRDYSWLHVNLKPHLVSASRRTTRDGFPLMAPVAFAAPGDVRARGIEDQYLLGRTLLVAPVVNRGESSRPVLLPPGDWIDFWSDALETGGRELTCAAPLEKIPVFARAGTVLPLLLDSSCQPGSPLTAPRTCLRLFPDRTGGARGTIEAASGRAVTVIAALARGYVRVGGMDEPLNLWIPWTGEAPRRITFRGRTLPRVDRPSSNPGWRLDAEGGRLIVYLDARGTGEVRWR